MKALYKPAAAPASSWSTVPSRRRPRRGEDPRAAHRDLRHRPAHRVVGRVGGRARSNAPLIPGHEFCGEVVEVGAGVRDVQVGDLVSGEGHVVCGTCRNCRAGRRHLCIRTSSVGVNRDGAFAEYVVLPESNVWVHRERIDPDLGAIFDPFGNAVHTALSFPLVGEDVLITGAGPIGLMAAAVARHVGARFVVITDVVAVPARRWPARWASTSRWTCRTSRSRRRSARLGMVEGFDVALEMSGHPSALPDVIANLNHGGRIAMLGLPSAAHRDRLGQGRHAHDHDQGHLRPRDVRDLVRDDRRCCAPAWTSRRSITHRFAGRVVGGGVRDRARRAVRQGRPGLDGALMYGSVREQLRATLDEIRAAGLYKNERQLASPQSAHVGPAAGTC